jgi:alkanesulfonate monooxygenase SsuD/methylene tetrahydromethanopterin reductase-like flavin-dependent oxidoreductase (luciferase family)
MKLGMMLPVGSGALGGGRPPRWRELRELVKLAEAVGFDALMVPDHLLFRRSPVGQVPAVDLPPGKTRGIWEAWSVLSAAAEATSRIHLGPLMACSSFRNPALLAKMAATLDEISDGRVLLGLGAGWHQPEYEAYGFPFGDRVSRFEEALQIIVPLLREGRVDFQGKYYQARECELQPRGPRPAGPPITIGAQGPRMLRLAARYADTYDTDYQLGAAAVAERYAALDRACADVGRAPGSIARSAGTRVALAAGGPVDPAWQVGPPRDGVAQYALDGQPFPARHGTPDEIVAHLRSLEAAGAGHVTVNVVDPPGLRGIERFARVIDALRR